MNLNSTSQLLARNESELTGKVLFANPEDTYARELGNLTDVYVWSQSKAQYDALI